MTCHLLDSEGDPEVYGGVDFHIMNPLDLCLSECIPQRFIAGIIHKKSAFGKCWVKPN